VIAPGATKIMRCRYSDIEAQATSVAGHEQAYTQLTPGRFDGLLESYVISDRAEDSFWMSSCAMEMACHSRLSTPA
jgi:hypothetical protein